MKLNFLKMLGNQNTTSDELAGQIAALELKKEQFEREKEQQRSAAKRLRQQKLCGDPVADQEIKSADKRLEDTALNLEAVEDSIEHLKGKLKEVLIKEKDSLSIRLDARNFELQEELMSAKEAMMRAKARLVALARNIWGDSAIPNLRTDGFGLFNNQEFKEAYEDEMRKTEGSFQRPFYHQKKKEYEDLREWVREFDEAEELEKILDKHRKAVGSPMPVT